ncbi:MAG: hypothetical protein JWQ71_2968 [Pedosphaera sp.]|nr:hypothetical protein [Pedosphaera sp.]
MKVIIRDQETRKYLSSNGRWVPTAHDAKDFLALVPAYNFAKENTCCRFQVVLYCPEDNYYKSIIDGTGMADDSNTSVASASTTVIATLIGRKAKSRFDVAAHLPAHFAESRNYLN